MAVFQARLSILCALEAGRHLCITWVPGHAGILENDAADQAAKEAGDGTGAAEERRLPHCVQGVRRRIEEYFDHEMQERWRGFITCHPELTFSWPFCRSLKWARFLTRSQISLVSQFLLNAFPSREFLYNCELVDSPECRFCGHETESRVHILEDCTYYAPIRAFCRLAVTRQLGTLDWELPALVPMHLRILARFLVRVKADWDAQIGGTPWGPRLG